LPATPADRLHNKEVCFLTKEPRTTVGYLPDDTPQFGKLLVFALQQVIVMFPATVLVAIITGFDIGVTIVASGLATIGFLLITGRRIPLYYGSSFSYIAAVGGVTGWSPQRQEARSQRFRPHRQVSWPRAWSA
jgi:xanthine/uracil permease